MLYWEGLDFLANHNLLLDPLHQGSILQKLRLELKEVFYPIWIAMLSVLRARLDTKVRLWLSIICEVYAA